MFGRPNDSIVTVAVGNDDLRIGGSQGHIFFAGPTVGRNGGIRKDFPYGTYRRAHFLGSTIAESALEVDGTEQQNVRVIVWYHFSMLFRRTNGLDLRR